VYVYIYIYIAIDAGSLFKVPFGGYAMALAGDIPVHFTSAKGGWGTKKGAIGAMMARCATLLRDGETNILVFPEGVRSATGELGAFKPGGFAMALEAGAPIVPVGLAGTREGWPKGDWKLSQCHARVRIGKPIEVKQLVRKDSESDDEWRARLNAAAEALMPIVREKILELQKPLKDE
jgi:1-acyl-sn-glycerol-3-phosphate acyltransferase